MNDINYNILNLSIDQGLKNLPIASGKNYLILLSAPPGANVRVKLNNNSGDDIPLKENYAIKSTDIQNIYISADSVANGVLVFGQASNADNFEIITAPIINSIESIGEIVDFNEVLLNKLDKIVNPYEFYQEFSGSTTSTSNTIVFNNVLDCDKIVINFTTLQLSTTAICKVVATLDSSYIGGSFTYAESTFGYISKECGTLEFDNVRGKVLNIVSSFHGAFILRKYNLKA